MPCTVSIKNSRYYMAQLTSVTSKKILAWHLVHLHKSNRHGSKTNLLFGKVNNYL
uniref:Uncharacterized protein n=1 Tax=Arundo donax TaxID=35708 RepID=A0A0A9FK31_ARUDO